MKVELILHTTQTCFERKFKNLYNLSLMQVFQKESVVCLFSSRLSRRFFKGTSFRFDEKKQTLSVTKTRIIETKKKSITKPK